MTDLNDDVSQYRGWRSRREELRAEWEAGADNLDGKNDYIGVPPSDDVVAHDRLHRSPDDSTQPAEARGDLREAESPEPASDDADRVTDQPEDAPHVMPRWKSKGSQTRRGYPIHAYIGANGHGKSLAMMHDTWLSIEEGRPILSTVRVLDPRTGMEYANFTPLRRWSQLLEFRDGDVLFDEVLGIAASEAGKALPKAVQLLLNQLRRRDILLRWTAPSWSRANVVLREVTQAVTMCRGYAPRYQSAGGRHWGMNTVFRWNTYDAFEFTTWSDNKEHNLKGKQNTWIARKAPWWWLGKANAELAAASYDTFDAVDNVDSGEGYCFRCGGERPKIILPKCTCGADH